MIGGLIGLDRAEIYPEGGFEAVVRAATVGAVKELLCGLAAARGVLGWVWRVWRATDDTGGLPSYCYSSVPGWKDGFLEYGEGEDSRDS